MKRSSWSFALALSTATSTFHPLFFRNLITATSKGASLAPCIWTFLLLQSFQNLHFPVVEKDLTGQLGNWTTEQDQQLDTPGQDDVQGNGPLEALSGLVLMLFHLAAAFENPVPFLDAPTPAVAVHQGRRLGRRLDFLGRQQQPFNRLGVRGRVLFPHINAPEQEGRMGLQIAAGRSHGDFLKADRQGGLPRRQGLVFRFVLFGQLAPLPREGHFQARLVRTRWQRFPQFLFSSLQTPIVLGTHQHPDPFPRRFGFCQQLEKVRFPVSHQEQTRLGHLLGYRHTIPQPWQPPEGLFLLHRTSHRFLPRQTLLLRGICHRPQNPQGQPIGSQHHRGMQLQSQRLGPRSDWFPLTPDPSSADGSKSSDRSCPAPPAPQDDSSSVAWCVSGAWPTSLLDSSCRAGCR